MDTLTTRLALLRGINVGGKNIIRMTDLKRIFEDTGYTNVQTYIQSGNVIFLDTEPDTALSKHKLESALRREMGVEIRTAILNRRETRQILSEKPTDFGEHPDTYRYDIIFLTDPGSPTDLASLIETRDGTDLLHAGENVIYLSRLKREITKSRFTKVISTPAYARMTIRNWNTTRRLCEIMDTR